MTEKIIQMKNHLDYALHDSSKPWTSLLGQIEQKTGVGRLYVSLGIAVVIGLWLVFGYCAQLLCNTLGFLYPAYISIHAIESKCKDDDTKWLTYWVIFALFSVFEYFSDLIVRWFPLYWLVKCFFLVWLMIPTQLNGSLILYNRIVKPYFIKHHGEIDSALNKVKDSAHKAFEKAN